MTLTNAPAAQPAALDSQFESAAAAAAQRINERLEHHDRLAIRLHKRYRAIALLASILGTAAVVLGILQMFISEEHHATHRALANAELVSALTTFLIVLYGISTATHHAWLIARHKSERFRALYAKTLIDLLLGNAPPLEAQLADVDKINHHDLHEWLKRDLVPLPPAAHAASAESDPRTAAFKKNFLDARLNPQADYLTKAEAAHEWRDRLTRKIPPAFFFLSVACVAVHAALHPFHSEVLAHAALFLVLAAALLPVLASGLRTYREATQFSRNASRFSSKAFALEFLRQKFTDAQSRNDVLTLAWHTEQILEAEHREWLRLMLDAEWFA